MQGQPVIVLINNDGCAIARCNEAKALGIAMGAPWFQIQQTLPDAGIVALSANCTLYGDMAGGFAVIKDVYKTLVYRLARYRNTLCADGVPVIPENIIVRPPSAELKPDQTDQDSLPPYEILDAIVRAYMEEDRSPREIIAAGLPEEAVRRVVRLLRISEHKRRQAPVGIRITPRGFGKDWRYPITNRYVDEF